MSDTDNIETSATKSRLRTITLTDRAPVTIYDSEWPIIGSAYSNNNEPLFSRAHLWLRVRKHQDGRTIVYGGFDSSDRQLRAGMLSEAMICTELVNNIRRVAALVNANDIAQDCIASLPAEKL